MNSVKKYFTTSDDNKSLKPTFSDSLVSLYFVSAIITLVIFIVIGCRIGHWDAYGYSYSSDNKFDYDIIGDDGFGDFIVWFLFFGGIGFSIFLFKLLVIKIYNNIRSICEKVKGKDD